MDPKNILKDANKFKQFTQHVLSQFDKNGNGGIEVAELKNALVQFAKEAKTAEPDDSIIAETMKELDKNNSNTLTIDEFENFVRGILMQMSG